MTYLRRAWRRLAVQPHHRGRRFEQILGLDKGDRAGKPRIGFGIVVGHPVPAAQQEIVTGEVLAFEQRHDCQVVGQNIDRVVLGDREPGLEFAWQITVAIERIRLLRRALIFLPRGAFDPDLVIAASARQQVRRQPARIRFEPAMDQVADRRRNCRHGAHDVAASG